MECVPTCKRAIRESVEHLKKQGHDLIEVRMPDEKGLIQALVAEISSEGGLKCFKDCTGRERVI